MKIIEFISAQNVKIEYELSTTAQRVLAAFIDMIALSLLSLIIYLAGSAFLGKNTSSGIPYLIFFLMRLPWVVYFPIIEYLTNGQSLGKYVMGVRVVTIKGDPPGFKEIFARWAFRGDFFWISPDIMILLWVGFGILGAFYSYISDKNQRLGDRIAKTVVIKTKGSKRYSLKDVLSLKTTENYVPTYPNVIQFTDEDMILIKQGIVRIKKYKNIETSIFIKDLAKKAAELLELDETPPKKVEFLKTLLQDYVVLTR